MTLPKLETSDKLTVVSALIPLVLWWLFIGRHKYTAPKGLK